MKKILKNVLIYLSIFILLFIIGIILSDIIIIARAKYMLKTADSLPFTKNMQQLYPTVDDNKNGLYTIYNVYKKRTALHDDLKDLDKKITNSDLRDTDINIETMRKFWDNKSVIAVIDGLESIPYTTKFSFNYAAEPDKMTEKTMMLNSMFNFYLHYMKFCSIEKHNLQTLHAFQKLLIINRALENQNLQLTETQLQKYWTAALDALVHYGPTDKQYEEYYKSLQQLIESLDFKYYPELTIRYNELKKVLEYDSFSEKNPFAAYRNKIGTLKYLTTNFYNFLRKDISIEREIFNERKILTQTRLKTLMRLKLFQIKNGFFPEAIEGFPQLPQSEKLIYKRISPNDFILR